MKSNAVSRSAGQAELRGKNRNFLWGFFRPVLRSRYFLTALCVHLVFLLIWGGRVLVEYLPPQNLFDSSAGIIVLPPEPPPRREESTDTPEPVKEIPVAVDPIQNVKRIATASAPDITIFHTPDVSPKFDVETLKFQHDLSKKIEAERLKRYARVKTFQSWDVQGSGRNTRAVFTVFKAQYKDGDWNCNPSDLENLTLQIRRWSRGRIQANLHPQVLNVGTDELFTIKPPFVYLTGHRDFRLLDTEVRNIREYLMLGGAVWADSALAGRRSRFDIAFRREMKRVFPDRDFEIAGNDHPIFNTFFSNIRRPSGMNFYNEPVEIINIGEELSVIYTLNGYGHYWEARLNENSAIEYGRINTGTDEKPVFRHVYGPHAPSGSGGWWRRTIYRNYDCSQVVDAYRLGINITVHLLTQYQQKFKLVPLELPVRDRSL